MTTAFSSKTQAELERVMGQEIDILRAILTNLKREEQALYDRNDHRVYALILERLSQLQRFEQLSTQLGSLTGSNADAVEAIEQLKNLLDAESLDLCMLHSQMSSLLEAIRSQRTTTYLFRQRTLSVTWTLPKRNTLVKKKIGLAVLEPE